MLHNAGPKGILRLKVKGDVQMRPTVCRGPGDPDKEVTFLQGVTKKSSKHIPSNWKERSQDRRDELLKGRAERKRIDG